MGVSIRDVEPGSPAARAGICAGMVLERIDGHPIRDVLDYRFYMTNAAPTLDLLATDGAALRITIRKGEYQDLGLVFATYLMDQHQRCKNKCVFCFIDQLPPNMRESLYFKDDDARMSFLFGNYITLTNLQEEDVRRILAMHISPINISVHTTNPALRQAMMGNPRAGKVLEWLPLLAEGGIRLNAQLVLCPGINDGPELERSLRDLTALAPGLQSVAVVPVGLTAHRSELAELRSFSRQEAAAVIAVVDRFGTIMEQRFGQRICHTADEFYLLAGQDFPPAERYGDFDQLENGVGLASLLRQEFLDALAQRQGVSARKAALATGLAAQPLLTLLAESAQRHFRGLEISVIGIENRFFGKSITVAGLVTGGDLIRQAKANLPAGCTELLIPAVMLRQERDLFLDDVTLPQVEQALKIPVRPVENDGYGLLDAMLGESL